MLDVNKVMVLSGDIVLRSISNKFWALNTKNGAQYKLNEVSYFILNCFRKEIPVSQMLDRVMEEYRVGRNQLLDDCDSALQIALKSGIIKEVRDDETV